MEIHCAARCSRDQNPLNSNGNLHYFVGTGIGGWFAGTMLETRIAFEPLLDDPFAKEVRKGEAKSASNVWSGSFGQHSSDQPNQDLPGLRLRLRGKDEVYSAKFQRLLPIGAT